MTVCELVVEGRLGKAQVSDVWFCTTCAQRITKSERVGARRQIWETWVDGKADRTSQCQRARFPSKLIALKTLDKDHFFSVIADREHEAGS